MELTAQVTPGHVFTDTELVTADKLNQLGTPVVTLAGLVGATALGPDAVATANIQDEAVTLGKLAAAVQALLGSASTRVGTRDLTIAPYSGAENRKVQITAAEAVLKNASGVAICVADVSVAVDFEGTPGAGALESGTAEAATTWYYLWLISKADGTIAGLGSLSDGVTGGLLVPTLPATYDYYCLVGAVYNDGSSNIRRFYQKDQQVWTEAQQIWNTTVGVIGGPWTGSQALGTYVPTTCKSVGVNVDTDGGKYAEIWANSDYVGRQRVQDIGTVWVPVTSGRTVYFLTEAWMTLVLKVATWRI